MMKRVLSRTLLFSVILCFVLMPMGVTYAYRGLKVALAQPSGQNVDDGSGFVAKDETVYVILDHDGKVLEQRVVNRI
ncbi:hypothetical protein [Caldicoprobacter algeriensis]|uniref:hypothetical protein n=1 Tax=Caldicoprobacter algeriensis TaxID=699281 RepID=UPI00207A7682|nr:hypothetical protein [Caldicoprobacter algeriensis]